MYAQALTETRSETRDAAVHAAIEAVYPRVYQYARFRLDREDAEDAVATAIEQVWRARRTYDPARGTANAWAYAVGINKVRDVVRSMRRRPRTVPLDDVDLAAPEVTIDRELLLRAIAAIRLLPKDDADLIALRFGAGLSNTEIAALTHRTPGAVGTAIHRLLARVRQSVSSEPTETEP